MLLGPHERLTLWELDWLVPLPLSVAVVELEASLTNARLPGELPAAWGENVTVKEMLFPAARVNGKVMPARA